MKVRSFLLIFSFALICIGCKQVPAVLIIKPKVKITVEDYAIKLAGSTEAQSLKNDGLLIKFIDTTEVKTLEPIVTVGLVEDSCSYAQLDNVYKLIPGKNFTSVWIAPESGSHLVIERRSDLEANYEWYERFKILGPKIYWVQIGNQIFYIKEGKIIATK